MSWIAAAVATVGVVGGIISRSKANKEARNALANRPKYQENEEIRKNLGLAQALYGGRAPGAAEAERNIYQTAANTQSSINRAATDANQAILGAGAIQGQTNIAFNQLQQQELADAQRRYQNLMSAEEAMAGEQKRAWDWNVMGKYQDTAAVNAAIAQNRANSWKDVTQMGMAAANISSSMGNVWGKGGKGDSGKIDNSSMMSNKVDTMPLYETPRNYNFNNIGLVQNPYQSYQYNQQFDLSNMGLYGGYRGR